MEKKLEYYTLKPNLKQYYGIKVDENTTFDEKTEDGSISQHFENLTLTTHVEREKEKDDKYPFDIKEVSEMTVKMPSGTILIWDEKEGFVISNYEMTTLSEIVEEVEKTKEIYKDSIV